MKIQPDSYGKLIGLGFLVMLIAFPVVMLYTLEEANKSEMAKHTNEISKVMNRLRSYYATAVVGKVIGSSEKIVASENHRGISNAIPIPATFSIEMGEIFGYSHNDTELRYNFTSDYPFLNRERTELDEFQKKALESFRVNRELKEYREIKSSWIGNSSHRMATPVFMEPACVACHNNHPAATKTNWIEGDIRGIQEVSVSSIEVNPANYSYLIIYFLALASFAAMSMNVFRLAANRLKRANGEIQLAKDKEHETALKLEAKVRELALLAAVANKSTFGVTIADCKEPDRPLIYANEAFYKMTGMKPEDVIGRNCRFLSGEQTSKEARSELRNAIDRGLSCTVDILNYRADGHTFWNRLTVFPVGGSDRNPDYYVGYQVDVTKTKKMEEERELLSQEIQDSKKHESLGMVFKTPVAVATETRYST